MYNIEDIEESIKDKTTYVVVGFNDESGEITMDDCYIKSVCVIQEKTFCPKFCVKYIKYDSLEEHMMGFDMDEIDHKNRKFDNIIIEMNKKFKIK